MKETDAIFQNLTEVHRRAAGSEDTLRLSCDAKAPVLIGPFSRGGYSRYGLGVPRASRLDHLVYACDELAGFLIASLQGAILQSKTERSAVPTERFKHLIFSTLLR